MANKTLNVGMIGYGFMARAHSNAWSKVAQFFDTGYRPVLKAVAARDPGRTRARLRHAFSSAHGASDRRRARRPRNDQDFARACGR